MNLNILYLNNVAGNEELQKLLCAPITSHKVIFQFYYEGSDALTLDGWAKKKLIGGYEPGYSVLLHDTKVPGMNLNGLNVHLGNVRILKEGYDLLQGVVNKTGCEFILFAPYIETEPKSGENFIVYNIYGDDKLPTSLMKILVKIPITNTKKPSPPY